MVNWFLYCTTPKVLNVLMLRCTPISSKGNTDLTDYRCFVVFVEPLVCALLSVAWAKGEINTDVTTRYVCTRPVGTA